jgi:L-rhamnono-1,4-lactonase
MFLARVPSSGRFLGRDPSSGDFSAVPRLEMFLGSGSQLSSVHHSIVISNSPTTTTPMTPSNRRFIDAHIHLFLPSHFDCLAWMTPTNPLRSSHSTDEYTAASSSSNLEGFIFVETDRSHTLPQPPFIPSKVTAHLEHALSEIEFAMEIHRHPQAGQPKLLGMVPFAPLPLGKEGMEAWASVLPEGAEAVVKGVRYLVQDKPSGTINAKRFVQGIRWVLERDWVFDLGVDLRSGGVWQLNEAVEALSGVMEGSAGTGRVVISECVVFLAFMTALTGRRSSR